MMITVSAIPGDPMRAGFLVNDSTIYASGVVNWRLTMMQHYWRPPTDFFELEDKFVIRVEIPGMRDGEFSVAVENNVLSVTGVRADSGERKAFHQMEIHYGEFATEVDLPSKIDVNQIQAEYEDGFLRIFLQKAQPKQIIVGD